MRVLAFDPGYERLGVAVVEKMAGKEVLLFSQCVQTLASLTFPERLKELGGAAERLIQEWQPSVVALEDIYFEKNAKTAIGVAQVRGVLAYIAATHHIKVCAYTPLQVKVAITGYGQSNKAAVAMMVARLIVLPAHPPAGGRLDDELDAIAIGLTCLASERISY